MARTIFDSDLEAHWAEQRPHATPNPVEHSLALIAFIAASLASFAAAGWAAGCWLYDLWTARIDPRS